MINAIARTSHAEPTEEAFPSRGRVGMVCLIATEAALFAIFVVAYLFYIGKSFIGPYPAQVLEVPILPTICLLAQGTPSCCRDCRRPIRVHPCRQHPRRSRRP